MQKNTFLKSMEISQILLVSAYPPQTLNKMNRDFEERDWMFTGYLVLVFHFLQFVSKNFKRWPIIRIFLPAVLHNLVTAKILLKLRYSCNHTSNNNFIDKKSRWITREGLNSLATYIKAFMRAFCDFCMQFFLVFPRLERPESSKYLQSFIHMAWFRHPVATMKHICHFSGIRPWIGWATWVKTEHQAGFRLREFLCDYSVRTTK